MFLVAASERVDAVDGRGGPPRVRGGERLAGRSSTFRPTVWISGEWLGQAVDGGVADRGGGLIPAATLPASAHRRGVSGRVGAVVPGGSPLIRAPVILTLFLGCCSRSRVSRRPGDDGQHVRLRPDAAGRGRISARRTGGRRDRASRGARAAATARRGRRVGLVAAGRVRWALRAMLGVLAAFAAREPKNSPPTTVPVASTPAAPAQRTVLARVMFNCFMVPPSWLPLP
jgi:hypothetical protein